jgi:predicted phosphodiesterase
LRLAILADVHGNLPALEAVIEDAHAHGAEGFIVNGDMVNRGPQGVEVMARLADLPARFTLGNHDDLLRRLAEGDAELPGEFHHDPFWHANRWCAAGLAAVGAFATIRGWPLTLRVELAGAPRVLISHGSPRHFREGYGENMSDALISEIIEMNPAEVLVGSHTHLPLRRRWGRVEVLNTGAVGTPFNGDGRAQYLLLTLQGGRWEPRFRRVAYDHASALAAFHGSGYLAAGGLLASLFYDEVRDARSYLVPFQMWAAEREVPLGEESFAAYRAAHPGHFAPVVAWPRGSASVAP